MRIIILTILMGSTILLSNQCKTKKNAGDKEVVNKNQKEGENDNHQHTSETVLVSGDFDKEGSASVEIKSASIKGNELTLKVSHSGGCGAHHFKLMGSKGIMKSMPPIRGLYLYHDNKGDQCRALLEHQITFNISKFAYKQEKGSQIKLRLDGWNDELMYIYK